jgi:hypothetical protein
MTWMAIVFFPFVLFIAWPLAALLPAALLGIAYFFKREWFIAMTAALWALYAIYEYLMKLRVLCTGECNIRVDLLLIAPFLLLATIVAVVLLFTRRKPRSGAA